MFLLCAPSHATPSSLGVCLLADDTIRLTGHVVDEHRLEIDDSRLNKVEAQIAGKMNVNEQPPMVDESDLSLKKLVEYHAQLQELHTEKSERLLYVLRFVSTVHDLWSVLGMDFYNTVTEVHSSLNDSNGVQSKCITNETLSRLAETVIALDDDKNQRLEKLQELAGQLINLWNMMDTLALDVIEQAGVKVDSWFEKEAKLDAKTEREKILEICWNIEYGSGM